MGKRTIERLMDEQSFDVISAEYGSVTVISTENAIGICDLVLQGLLHSDGIAIEERIRILLGNNSNNEHKQIKGE